MGSRTLYYHANRQYLFWSNSLNVVMAVSGASKNISADYVAGYLIGQPEPNLTPYKEVMAVPPGHVLDIQGSGAKLARFWWVDPKQSIVYTTDQEYEEHFLHLFRQVIADRMRGRREVWAELSGGLDSSAIVSMADEILAAGESSAKGLHTVSYLFNHSKSSDESKHIRYLEEKRGRQGHHISEDEQAIFKNLLVPIRRSVPDPLDCFPGRENILRQQMRQSGAKVLMSGHGGDHLLWSSISASPELADFLINGQISQLLRSLTDWTTAGKSHFLGLLWHGALEPSLPRRIRRRLLPASLVPRWIDIDFARRHSLRDRLLGLQDPFSFQMPSKRRQCSMLLEGIVSTAAGSYHDWDSVEIVYPFQDRRLIEFFLAIPVDQLIRPGETRSIQRRAMQRVLPSQILQRKGKKGPTEAILRAISAEWQALQNLFQNAQVWRNGFVDKEVFLDSLARARMGEASAPILLLAVVALECWLQLNENVSSNEQSGQHLEGKFCFSTG